MGFDAEMSRFCGRTARVKARATRCVDERTGRMLTMKNPCIILEDIVCEGAFTGQLPARVRVLVARDLAGAGELGLRT